MKNGFEIQVPITLKGEGGASKKLAEDFTKSIKDSFKGFGIKGEKAQTEGISGNIGKIAASVGIIATIWQGIAPILKPVLKMFSILLTLLLIPLMPLIKQMVSGLAKTAQNVRTAQEEAGGGYAGFIAGLAEVFKSPTIWAFAGIGLAAAFVAGLGTAGIAGLLAGLISLNLLWDSITGGDEKTLAEKLKTAGWAGLSTGIAALIFGAGVYALPIGLLAFSLSLGLSFLAEAWKEETFKEALMSAAAGSAMLGIVAGGIVALLGLGLGTAGIVTIGVGTLIFSAFVGFKLGKQIKEETQELNAELEKQKGELSFVDKAWSLFGGTVLTFLKNDLIPGIASMGFMIGSPTRGSYPIVYALKQAENEWQIMRDISVTAINNVITNLNRIPRTITTTHYIRTVKR